MKHLLQQISEEELKTLIKLGTGKHLDIDIHETFVSAFERQAKKTPESLAVADEVSQLTYAELSGQSDLLAHKLIDLGVKPDDFVCIMLDRVKEFPLWVIGIMKAGAAYVPMDTEYPIERLQYILEDSQAKVLITDRCLLQEKQTQGMSLPEDIRVVFIDDTDFSEKAAPVNLSTPDGLAYMIYTSGSTGRPKGTMLHHAGLWNFIYVVIDLEQLDSEDRIAGHFSFSFCAHTMDMYPILTLGGSFHIMPSAIRKDLHAIRQFLFDHRITGGGYVTTMARLLLNAFDDLPVCFIVAAGEKLEDVYSDHIEIINGYGATECTCCTNLYKIPPGTRIDNIPIGKPAPGVYSFIVDAQGRLLPQGMAGELYIAGIQVGRGYWHHPELTVEKFDDCPFMEQDAWGRKLRMYRTGDLCRWNEEGQLEYLGRNDQQVNLRGFRIELGEIASLALRYEGIRQAVADVYDGQLLCLYYTSDVKVDKENLRQSLSATLPDYMVPAAFIQLEAIPLTPNGKVDRKQLPKSDMTGSEEFIAPEGESEKKIADTFAEVLNLTSPVSALDNFFSLGGDSIKTIRLVSRLKSEGIMVQVSDVLQRKTVRAIAQAATHSGVILRLEAQDRKSTGQEAAVKVAGWTDEQFRTVKEKFEARGEHIERIYPLTYTQDFSLYEITSDPDRPVLMISESCTLSFAPTREQLEYVTDQLVNLHEVLRTAIVYQEVDFPQQAIIKDRRIPIKYLDLTDIEQDAQDMHLKELAFREANQCMNLEDEPLFRLVCAKTSESSCQLFIIIQHIISDGWSMTVLMHDFMQLLEEALTGRRKKHEGVKGIFEKYVACVNQLCETGKESYWSRFIEGYSTELIFPLQDKDIRNSKRVRHEHAAPITLDEEEAVRIKQLCSQEGITQNTVFVLALGLLMQRYNHTNDILFAKTTSGRDQDIPGIEHAVGMFIQDIPVRLKTAPADTPRTLLKRLMQQAAESKNHEHELTSALAGVPKLAELYEQNLPVIIFQNFVNNDIDIDYDYLDKTESIFTDANELDFCLYVNMGDTFELSLDYDTSIYPTSDMTRLLEDLRKIIRDICDYPDKEWRRLSSHI